jgi:predicted RecB family nuclease
MIPAYKAQCRIYTEIIGRIQSYTSPVSFLLGRRYKYTSKKNNKVYYNSLHTLGRISYNTKDNHFIEETHKAIQWVKNVRMNGHEWTIDPPSRPELYPNMNIDSGSWNCIKNNIANKIGELTLIWNININNRDCALKNGVYNIHDKNCTSNELGIKKTSKKTTIIDNILDINRQHVYNITPIMIPLNKDCKWHTKSTNEAFVDFETFPDIFADFDELPYQYPTDMIFMIGIVYEENGSYIYKSFTCKKQTVGEEYQIMKEFAEFIEEKKIGPLYHWCADESFWNRACKRHYDSSNIPKHWILSNWIDLCHVFKSTPIIIRGSYKFGLKSIASAMNKHGMIDSTIDSECTNGLQAVMDAWNCYTKYKNPVDTELMNDILKYNEFDCYTLCKILIYLRNEIIV